MRPSVTEKTAAAFLPGNISTAYKSMSSLVRACDNDLDFHTEKTLRHYLFTAYVIYVVSQLPHALCQMFQVYYIIIYEQISWSSAYEKLLQRFSNSISDKKYT